MVKNRIPTDAEANRHVWKPAKTTPWKAPGTSYQVPDGDAKSRRERKSHAQSSPRTAVQPGLTLSSNSCHSLFQKMPSLIVLYSPSVYLLAGQSSAEPPGCFVLNLVLFVKPPSSPRIDQNLTFSSGTG